MNSCALNLFERDASLEAQPIMLANDHMLKKKFHSNIFYNQYTEYKIDTFFKEGLTKDSKMIIVYI